MGLDTSHDCWHGGYISFMRWRQELAKAANIPLPLMESFYSTEAHFGTMNPFYFATQMLRDVEKHQIEKLMEFLPIKWESLKPDVLHQLLYHSDCDGKLEVEILEPLANRLEELLPLLPDTPAGGHISSWKGDTQQFIDGLRDAATLGEPVEFR